MLSDKEVLLKCLGAEVAKKLEKCASDALGESTSALHTLSERRVSLFPVTLNHKPVLMVFKWVTFLQCAAQAVEAFGSEGDAGRPASPKATTRPPASPFPPAADSDNGQKLKGALNTARQEAQPSTEPGTNSHLAADATKQDPARASVEQADPSVTCDAGSIRQHVPGSETSDVPSLTGSVSVTPKNTLTIILNMDQQESVDPHVPRGSQEAGFCNASLTEVEAKPVEGNECEDTSERHKKVFTIVLELEPQRENAGATASHLVRRSDGAEVCDEDTDEPPSSSTCHSCQPSGVSAAQSPLPRVRREQGTDSCQRSAPCPVEDEERTETPTRGRERATAGTSVPSSGRGQAGDLDGPGRDDSLLEGESTFLSLLVGVSGETWRSRELGTCWEEDYYDSDVLSLSHDQY